MGCGKKIPELGQSEVQLASSRSPRWSTAGAPGHQHPQLGLGVQQPGDRARDSTRPEWQLGLRQLAAVPRLWEVGLQQLSAHFWIVSTSAESVIEVPKPDKNTEIETQRTRYKSRTPWPLHAQ